MSGRKWTCIITPLFSFTYFFKYNNFELLSNTAFLCFVLDCKVLFKHDLTLRNKDLTWHSCSYCSGFGSKMLHSHYGGKIEQFCKPHCMSQYTVLHYGVSGCYPPTHKQSGLNGPLSFTTHLLLFFSADESMRQL